MYGSSFILPSICGFRQRDNLKIRCYLTLNYIASLFSCSIQIFKHQTIWVWEFHFSVFLGMRSRGCTRYNNRFFLIENLFFKVLKPFLKYLLYIISVRSDKIDTYKKYLQKLRITCTYFKNIFTNLCKNKITIY